MDALARAIDASKRADEATAEAHRWALVRRDAVRELVAAGWSYSRIAEALSVSKAMVQKLLR